MQGKIIKGIAGFYYVYSEEGGIWTCKARGLFRNQKIKPLVGDDVEMEITDPDKKEGSILRILPRKSELIRPSVANADQAVLLFAVTRPDPNFNLLDRFLILMQQQSLPCIVVFNKMDLKPEEEAGIRKAYENCDVTLCFISAREGEGLEPLKALLTGKTSVLAGPSGVGKSTLTNLLSAGVKMETGAVSEKIGRGRHTTRHSEIIALGQETFLMDTPGFTSLGLFDLRPEQLREYYPEFDVPATRCRFQGCVHISEPDCGVKEALIDGAVSQMRYANYCQMHQELSSVRRYR